MNRLVEWIRQAGRWVRRMFAFRGATASLPLTMPTPKTPAVSALPQD